MKREKKIHEGLGDTLDLSCQCNEYKDGQITLGKGMVTLCLARGARGGEVRVGREEEKVEVEVEVWGRGENKDRSCQRQSGGEPRSK